MSYQILLDYLKEILQFVICSIFFPIEMWYLQSDYLKSWWNLIIFYFMVNFSGGWRLDWFWKWINCRAFLLRWFSYFVGWNFEALGRWSIDLVMPLFAMLWKKRAGFLSTISSTWPQKKHPSALLLFLFSSQKFHRILCSVCGWNSRLLRLSNCL